MAKSLSESKIEQYQNFLKLFEEEIKIKSAAFYSELKNATSDEHRTHVKSKMEGFAIAVKAFKEAKGLFL